MRFTQTLTSHLTPEWRKHYIDYESLKKMIYAMIGQPEPSGEEGRWYKSIS
jgi:SPX domain protein involved in polyphosphate accumulation